jgi:uncharacterized protein (TIGR02453 family)
MAAFNGFSTQLVNFFQNLNDNNSKQWFEAHRKIYDDHVLQPAREFVVEMGKKLEKIAPAVNAIPKINQSLFRINRDTRFSKDKRPYKTHMGIWFWEGHRKRMECSGFYFHVEEGRLLLATGVHCFTPEILTLYRDAVIDKTLCQHLEKAVKEVSVKGYSIGGKHYKRIPRGYDSAHKNSEFLLHNGLYAMVEEKIPKLFFSPAVIDYSFSHFQNMLPLHSWLNKAIAK